MLEKSFQPGYRVELPFLAFMMAKCWKRPSFRDKGETPFSCVNGGKNGGKDLPSTWIRVELPLALGYKAKMMAKMGEKTFLQPG